MWLEPPAEARISKKVQRGLGLGLYRFFFFFFYTKELQMADLQIGAHPLHTE
jgi:hypothetical protein